MSILPRLIRRLRGDERGAVAVQFAFLILPIAVLCFGLLDVSRVSLQRRQMQDALDAATLMAARSPATTDAQLDAVGDAAFLVEISGLDLGMTASNATFTAGTDNHILGAATATLKPIVANLWTNKDFVITATSDVVRSSKNLEVAVVLDITGSMSGTRITDLKTGASDLVDIIVKDIQTPYYSKVAIVPYSNSVNVEAAYADAVRGAVPVRAISGAAWAYSAAKTITGVTKASNAVVTSNAHGYVVGDRVLITGLNGTSTITALNNNIYSISARTTNTFTLSGANTSTNSSGYSSGGKVTKCTTTACSLVVTTSQPHGFITGDLISFAGMQGLTVLNGTTQSITQLTTTTFDTGVYGPGTSAYTSGGTATCNTSTNPGCTNFTFTNASNYAVTRALSTCVSERIGDEAYTDVAPSAAPVGRVYPAPSGNGCPSAGIMPLSTDRAALKAKINSLSAAGSTAGHIGLAWGWYMISPNFGYLWPNAVQKPAAYKTKDLVKVVVLMTDGAFNTPYCKGVIAKNAGSGSGSNDDHINCDATNGTPFAQAKKICDAIKVKANDITLYTVGFDVGNDATAVAMLKDCATDKDHVYFPANGAELKTAFKSIAQDISQLRIAK